MGLFKKIIIYACLPMTLIANHSIDYLVTSNKVEEALDSYLQEFEKTQKHNYSTLSSIAHKLLENGANSTDIQEKILTIYGLRIASRVKDTTIIERLAQTANPSVQIACMHLLNQLADDRLQEFYKFGLNSSFLQVRFEAIINLVMRNDPKAFGSLTSIMNLIPPAYHASLVELFAILNSDAAKQKLKSFLSSTSPEVRLAAIKAISDHNLNEFTDDIRRFLSHTDPKVKEAALLFAKKQHDIHALQQIKLALKSPYKNVQIAAILADNSFSSSSEIEPLIKLAEQKDLFAIAALEKISEAQSLLVKLLTDKDQNVRFNAAHCLLKQKNNSCKNVIKEMLRNDSNYNSIHVHTSPGLTLNCIKSSPLSTFTIENQKNFYKMQTQNILESALAETMHLDEESFLEIIESVFEKKQLNLIPLAIKLLENRSSPKIEKFIKNKANCLAAPLIRSYAQLSLYKRDKTILSKKQLHALINSLKYIKIIEFDEGSGLSVDPRTNSAQFDLSRQQKSSLFLQALELLLQEHDADALTCLTKVFKTGIKQNRYIIAGLIIKCLD